MQLHHRKPRSLGGTCEARNISRVKTKKHRAYHMLFANCSPEQIATELNRTWIDPDFELVAVRKCDRKIIIEGI